MGSVMARSAIKTYVSDMQRQLAEMLEEIDDPLAPEARRLADRLREQGDQDDRRALA